MARSGIIAALGAWLLALPLAAQVPPPLDPRGATYDPAVRPATHLAPSTTNKPSGDAPLPLTQRDPKSSLPRLAPPERSPGLTPASSLTSMFVSLGVVLALFMAAAWAIKRSLPAGAPTLPSEVVELLGRVSLGSRQQAHLLRCGNKLLLVSLFPGGAETLTEVTDPLEVDRLVGLCQSAKSNSATQTFRQVLEQFAREKPAPAVSPAVPSRAVDRTLAAAEDDDV